MESVEQTQDELQERTKNFIDRYGELVQETKIDFASFPVFEPDGQGGFKIIIRSVPMDVSSRPEPSPFMQQD